MKMEKTEFSDDNCLHQNQKHSTQKLKKIEKLNLARLLSYKVKSTKINCIYV